MTDQHWFEMADIRRRDLSKSVWIPLRAVATLISEGEYAYEGYKEEFFGCGTLAVPSNKIDATKKLEWMDIGIGHQHSGRVESDGYLVADLFHDHQDEFEGVHLVLEQSSDDEEPNVWHLNQDLVLSLRLRREGNSWVCPQQGYEEAARIKFADNGKPTLLEIKAKYLKDYLCARQMTLYLTQFFSRDFIAATDAIIDWPDGESSDKSASSFWEGRISPIHEGNGHPYGEGMAIFHVSRTDVEESDDVPDISGLPTDDNTTGNSWTKNFDGRKLYRIIGELWRNEVIEPAKQSQIVKGDEIPSNVYFAIDADGTKACGRELIRSGKWLWFRPELMMGLTSRRGGFLSFYTEQTGAVSCTHGNGVHFGVNNLGLINVYAKDVGLLPEWQQQIWAGYNIAPEGGVSAELLASQVRADPADTQAPESFLSKGIEKVNEISVEKLGIKIFRNHDAIPELLKKTHRFRAVDDDSLYSLAKDLARLLADSLDAEAMQTIVPPPKNIKWGSLKSLEGLLASKYKKEFVRKITASLVGVYELRHADAHLPGSKIDDAFKLIDVDRSLPYVHQGYQLLREVVSSIYGVAEGLKHWPQD